jgi:PEP-CTERM motif
LVRAVCVSVGKSGSKCEVRVRDADSGNFARLQVLIGCFPREKKMKRAMGVVGAVLAFAVVAHADRIAYGSREYAARTGEDFRSVAPSLETSHSPYLLKEPGKISFGAGDRFPTPDDPESLAGGVFYADFADSAKPAEDPVEFDSIRGRLNGFDGRGENLGFVHSDPFHRAFAVEEVPEPQTLLLLGVGLLALAIWKQRSAVLADHSARAR